MFLFLHLHGEPIDEQKSVNKNQIKFVIQNVQLIH